MSEDQTMSAEEFQNQYFNDESEGLDGEMEYDLETDTFRYWWTM